MTHIPDLDLTHAFRLTLWAVAVLWAVHLAGVLLGIDLVPYGIYPRRMEGAAGIVFAPLIHASFSHLAANSMAIVVLGTALLRGYPRSAVPVLLCLYAGTGAGVWLFARGAWHIGASGVTFGMLFFVFLIGVIRWDRRAIALAMVVSFLYGGMVWGIFPGRPGISFESHLCGAIIGAALAIVLRNRDPAPPEKRYSWELEEEPRELEEDPQNEELDDSVRRHDDSRRLH